MLRRTRTITLSAVFTALTVVFLYIGNILPTGRLALVAVASLFAVAAVIEAGIVSAVFVFVGSSIIGALILPEKTAVLIYILFFGYYPVIKSIAEKLRSALLKWIVKLIVFEAAFSVIWFLFKSIIFDDSFFTTSIVLVYFAGSAAFILFDIGLTRLIGFYIVRISKNIRKNNR